MWRAGGRKGVITPLAPYPYFFGQHYENDSYSELIELWVNFWHILVFWGSAKSCEKVQVSFVF